jgi:cobalt/nickel transport system ATP-binding protein
MIKTEALNFRYSDGTLALKGINFDSEKGQIIGIIGGNGSGKTTFFKSIVGLNKPLSGKVLLNNEPVCFNKRGKNKLLDTIGFIFQEPDQQLFYSDIFDDVAFGLRNMGIEEKEVKNRVNEALEKVDALAFVKKPIHFLSQGQKKRVALASVLVLDKKIILFDEPLSTLDPKMSERMIELIIDLKNQGIKIILSSHNMELIYRITDYCYVFKSGKIIKEGKTKTVFLDEETLNKADLNQPWIMKFDKKVD